MVLVEDTGFDQSRIGVELERQGGASLSWTNTGYSGLTIDTCAKCEDLAKVQTRGEQWH